MNRRSFNKSILALATVAMISPSLAIANEDMQPYLPGDIEEALKAGETVFVDYATDWCSTCKAQERVVKELRASNPAYNKAMTFIRVDWDVYSSHKIATSHNIPRRSTLLVLKGDKELGRVVAGTSKSAIKKLMDAGL